MSLGQTCLEVPRGGAQGLLNTFHPEDGQAFAGGTAWLARGSGDVVPSTARVVSSSSSKPAREHPADRWTRFCPQACHTQAHGLCMEAGNRHQRGSYKYKDKPTHLPLTRPQPLFRILKIVVKHT